MHPVRTAAFLILALIATGATFAVAQPGDRDGGDRRTATLRDAKGKRVGSVVFRQNGSRGPITVLARVNGLPAGFHGFHIHAVGQCRAPDFTSAQGHLKQQGQNHPSHIGDLPVLLVNRNGSGRLVATSDRFEIRTLRDADGSAVIVHANPDNYANVTRYGTPDQATLDTGDAGPRLACGQVR
jgi:superoxide dismutase, Cu-Zn family